MIRMWNHHFKRWQPVSWVRRTFAERGWDNLKVISEILPYNFVSVAICWQMAIHCRPARYHTWPNETLRGSRPPEVSSSRLSVPFTFSGVDHNDCGICPKRRLSKLKFAVRCFTRKWTHWKNSNRWEFLSIIKSGSAICIALVFYRQFEIRSR